MTGDAQRANSNKPWYRKVKDTWYCWKDGKQVSLGVRGTGNKKQAQEAFFRLMATEAKDEPPKQNREHPPDRTTVSRTIDLVKHKVKLVSSIEGDTMTSEEIEQVRQMLADEFRKAKPEPPPTPTTTVQQLVDSFLKDKQDEITLEAWRGYRKFLLPFAAKFGDRSAESLTGDEAEDFAKNQKWAGRNWSPTYRAGFLGTLVSAFRWAVKKKLLGASPVEGVKKPQKASRGTKAVITDDEHKKLFAEADEDFRDLLVVLWHTGARPGEVTTLTAEQVKGCADGVVPLDNHKTAHKGKNRFLILTGDALEVAKRRAEVVGSGLLWTGQNGKLSPKAVSAKMERLVKKAGLRRGVIAYGYRHTFATAALTKGVPDATVAALLGHADTTMLHKHYSHLTAQTQALKTAMSKVRAESEAGK